MANNAQPEERNNFSYWYPKVQNCGIPTPKTLIVDLPPFSPDWPEGYRLWQAFFYESPREDRQAVQDWLDENVIPKLKVLRLTNQIFVKNARFSNKFMASKSCLVHVDDLASSVIEINNAAMLTGSGGLEELIIREVIPHNPRVTPEIYCGLPLRPEYRVFYDFDTRQPLYTVNYWDYDYVAPSLTWASDRIIFDHENPRLDTEYEAHKAEVQDMVAQAMAGVTGLEGQWSVDILQDENGRFWLIDMAVAQRSAYWRYDTPAAEPNPQEVLEEQVVVEMPKVEVNPITKREQAPKQGEIVPVPSDNVPLNCAICGAWLTNTNAAGIAYCSSHFNGTNVCDSCALDHCITTECDQCDRCPAGSKCSFKDTKEFYLNESEA